MTSVFCKDLKNIKTITVINNQYSFLNGCDKYNVNIIYKLLNSQQNYKIKNLYRFIYLRTNRLKREFSKLNNLKNHKLDIDPLFFNIMMDEYIDNNIINEIIIVNSILLYFYPN